MTHSMLRFSSLAASAALCFVASVVNAQTISPIGGSGGGLLPPLCGDSSHALGGTGSAFTCQAITGSAAPGGSNTQVQYNSSAALAGISGVTSNGVSMTFVSGDIILKGSSTGTTSIASANASATSFTATLPAATDTIAELAASQTFTNKTYSAGALSGTFTGTPTFSGALTFSGSWVGGTPASLTLTNATGLPIASLTGLGTGVATALGDNVGSAGAFVTNGGALGTPSSGTATNITGYLVTNLSGLGSGVGTALGITHDTTGGICTVGGTGCPGGGSAPTLTQGNGVLISTSGSACSSCTISLTNTLVTKSSGFPYAILSTDGGSQLDFSSASASSATLPVSSTSGYGSGAAWQVQNVNTGAFTLTATTSIFDNSASSLVLAQGQGALIWGDGTNYHSFLSLPVLPADNLLGNFSGSSNYPVAGALPACANDGAHGLVYPSGSHAFACASITGSGGGFSITDGTHTVTGATALSVTGGTVGGTSPNATLTISGGGSSQSPVIYVTGNWYWSLPGLPLDSSTVVTANQIFWTPLIVYSNTTLKNLGLAVAQSAASGHAEMALYANATCTGTPNFNCPTGTPLATTSSLSIAGFGNIAGSINQAVTPGLYWIGTNVDAAAVTGSARFVDYGTTENIIGYAIGAPTQAGISNGGGGNSTSITSSSTYGTWPTLTTSSSFTIAVGGGVPAVQYGL